MKTNYQTRNDDLSIGGYMGRLSLVVAPVMIATLVYLHLPTAVQKKLETLYGNTKELETRVDNDASLTSDQSSPLNHTITRYKQNDY